MDSTDEILAILKDNNEMLKEILSIMRRITSKKHIQKGNNEAFTINLLANMLLESFNNKIR